jgi:hypothetical protein
MAAVTSAFVPTATIRSFLIAMACAMENRSSTVMTFPSTTQVGYGLLRESPNTGHKHD